MTRNSYHKRRMEGRFWRKGASCRIHQYVDDASAEDLITSVAESHWEHIESNVAKCAPSCEIKCSSMGPRPNSCRRPSIAAWSNIAFRDRKSVVPRSFHTQDNFVFWQSCGRDHDPPAFSRSSRTVQAANRGRGNHVPSHTAAEPGSMGRSRIQ